MKKKIIGYLLAMSMLLTALPINTLAENSNSEPENKYTDVKKTDWFYESVMYCLENGVFNGTGEGAFSPDAPLTRAMFVTVLGRIAGIDVSKYSASAYKDVAAGEWYAPYVAWAAEMGITQGTDKDTFSPNEAITREQMAVMTARFFKFLNISYEAEKQTASGPKDEASISSWALDSVLSLWCAGLLTGDENGFFSPASRATRAEVAAFCMRISRTVKQQEEKEKKEKEKEKEKKEQPAPIQTSDLTPTPTPTQNPGNNSDTTYTIAFVTNGGEAVESMELKSGTALSNLPVPYKMDAIFLGWYKDSGLTTPVSSTDAITGNMTLYAKYAASNGFTEELNVPSISKLDQDKSFTITVVDSTKEMSAAEVKAGITFDSPSNPDFPGVDVNEASGGEFIVSAIGGAFDEGGTYKLTLDDDRLFFKDEDSSTRICTFTIAKSPVMNLSLNKNIKYISADQVSNMTKNGSPVQLLSIPLVRVDGYGTKLSGDDAEEGTFEYDGGGIDVGDTVAIYEGIRPDERDLNTSGDDAGAIAYVAITAINGTTYSYVKADTKTVLFKPDVLPVNTAADMDGSSDNGSITVPQSAMTYTDAVYANIGLSAATTVDVGDFIAFHTGTFGSADAQDAGYAEITSVVVSGGNYIIAYMSTTLEEMRKAAALYTTKEIEGDELLGSVDIEALENSVERQAIQSGFADEAALYLTELAMETDSFKKLNLTTLAYKPSAVNMPMLLAAGQGPEVKNLRANANVYTNVPHLGGSGARMTLTISCDIVFQAAGEDNNIVIRLSGSFEQEVKVNFNVSSQTKWELINGWFWWAADTLVTASTDIGAYTSVNINAKIGTFEKGAEFDLSKFEDIGKQIKDVMNNKKAGDRTIADTLRERYKSLLEDESDWINLYEKEIFSYEQAIDPLHIIVFGLDVNFVVGANMNVSVGCNFSYQQEKRYIFTMLINAQTATSDTVDLIPEQYNFTFYILGTLGLRAGISAEIKVGLFTLDVASIGIEGEVGAYVQLWGYFYYEASYRAATGLTSKCAGALYMELGIYLEISFVAQAVNNMFEYEATLYENQWPLLSCGSQENVYDFSYSTDKAPTVFMAKQTKSFVLPDSVLNMNYMDMKTGDVESKYYDPANFDCIITNSHFTYNPETKTVTVAPDGKDIEEGTLTLIWKGNSVAFTSVPIARTIPLHWEDLKSAYTISFNSNGGSAVDPIALPYNTAITPPANPAKVGYVFGGWYKDAALTQSYAFPATMPAEDTVLYAKWNPAPDTRYRVEHYQQNLENDLYTLVETEYRTGRTDTLVGGSYYIQPKSYEGFSVEKYPERVRILPDGSTALAFYYKRNSYTATFLPRNNNSSADVVYTVKFGGKINVPVFTWARHSFAGWSQAIPETMPAQNMTFEAQWTTVGQVAYKVEHYKEGLDGSYVLAETENLSDVANQTVTATAKSYEGFSYNRNAPGTVPSGIVTANGNLVLRLYYTRNSYTLTFDPNGGTGGIITRRAKYGEPISAPTVTREGCNLTGWSPAVPATMPSADATYTAQWQADGLIPYRVEHYLQNIDDSDGFVLADVENLRGAEGDTVTANAKSYTGYEFLDNHPTIASGTIASDGSLVLKLYYMRKKVRMTFASNGGSMWDVELDCLYGEFVYESSPGTQEGYAFNGWSPAFLGTAPVEDATYTAQWTANISGALDFTADAYANQNYSAAGVNWDCATKTLTLTDVAVIAADGTDSFSDNFAIRVPGGSAIILDGSNYLASGRIGRSCGILCDGDLTIRGPGTLTVLGAYDFMSLPDQSACYGIYTAGTITTENGAAVIAKSTGADGNSCGIFAENIVIANSAVLASSENSANGIRCGIYASGNISITDSTVNTPNGIYASGDVAISQSAVNALNSSIEYPNNVFNYYGIYGDNVTIVGGKVYAAVEFSDGYGIYAADGVAITGGAAVTSRCGRYGVPGSGNGIFAGAGSISISGSAVIAAGYDAVAMNQAPVLDGAGVCRASANADGSDGAIYNPDDMAAYKYILIRAD